MVILMKLLLFRIWFILLFLLMGFQVYAHRDHEKPADRTCFGYIPQAISPNGDGINDIFVIEPACEVSSYLLQIYNQRRQLIFETYRPPSGWDGVNNGTPAQQGVYTWELRFVDEKGQDRILTGELTLVR